ncbi:MAG: branched-chain amino acid ABC transporter permease, partial [Myxococcota bacterium]
MKAFALLGVALLVAGPWLPPWLSFISTVSLAHALVVAGVLMLLRTGLVSFGQGLYYCLGGYTVGIAGQQAGLRDAAVLLPLAVVTSLTLAAIVGLL